MSPDPAVDVPKWQVVPSYATDLFAGTAEYYDKYRVPYPEAMLNDMIERARSTGQGRLLDLACGTGELALPSLVPPTTFWDTEATDNSCASAGATSRSPLA
jgi:hypothetical protein